MKLFIPAIGEKIKLTADWTFVVHPEYRNHSLYELANQAPVKDYLWSGANSQYGPKNFTLPAGITLVIDRIYIKKGAPDYNSVTFRIPKKGTDNPPHFTGLRFWVKLNDANKIECDVVV